MMKIAVQGLFALGLLSFVAVAWAEPEGLPGESPGWTAPLAELGIDGSLESLMQPRDWRTYQVSSYDRDGGNDDDRSGAWIYDGGVVMADLEGPGVVTRIWTREPQGMLWIYVDDLESPVVGMPFEDLFGDKEDLAFETEDPELMYASKSAFKYPLTTSGNGGYVSYVPIPYEKHCRLVVVDNENPLPYQVTYVALQEGTDIQSFSAEMNPADAKYFDEWEARWTEGNPDLRWPDEKNEKSHHSRHIYWPNKNTQVFPIAGPGVITELELRVESADPGILDDTWLVIYFDGQSEPGVSAPLGPLFGGGDLTAEDFKTLAVGRMDGRMWVRYPMPFRKSAEIRLVTESAEKADISYWITWRPGDVGDAAYFFARYNAGTTVMDRPYPVADITGQGHFVGATISTRNGESLKFLEGDDVYLVDGDGPDRFHGTGTDDYFNGGWYFAAGPASAATHAVTSRESQKPAAFSAHRAHLVEAVPFDANFRFELEHGPQNDQPGLHYSSVAYWYQPVTEQVTWPAPEAVRLALSR